MINEIINQISDEFILEAKNSPKLLKDMASMELYLAESYGERVLIELLQNADDANSSKVLLKVIGNTIIFANNGRLFNKNDIISICRSGNSNKKRGRDIGYRGVGFKSSTSISKEIIIHSGNAAFTFSKSKCAETLNLKETDVPTVRVPFPVNKEEIKPEIISIIKKLEAEDYTSIFIFKDSKISIIEQEIKDFDKSSFLFLKNISQFEIEYKNMNLYEIQRKQEFDNVIVQISNIKELDEWFLPTVMSENNFAFRLKSNSEIKECKLTEAVFHCYLPTLETTPFKFKINSDFTTDPSRKHLTLDKNTKEHLEKLSDQLMLLIDKCINEEWNYPELMQLFCDRISYSQISSVLYDNLMNKLKNKIKVTINNGKEINLSNYQVFGELLTSSEKTFIRRKSKFFKSKSSIHNHISYENFFEYFSEKEFSVNDYIVAVKDYNFVSECNSYLLGKIYSRIFKNSRINELVENKDYDFSSCLIKNSEGDIVPIVSKDKSIILEEDFKNSLKTNLDENDIKWVQDKIGLLKKSSNKKEGIKKRKVKTSHNISRWRTAEQQCVDIEISLGNDAKYVGNQNLGYDVLSKDSEGNVRYIEVKSVSNDNGTFTMTNNEYTSAHDKGEDYYICVIVQKSEGLKATYIKNPLKNAKLEKRVRQWEWFCENFTGSEYSFEY
jgi:hypothetical protein